MFRKHSNLKQFTLYILPWATAIVLVFTIILWRNHENSRYQKGAYQTLQRTASTVFKCLQGAIQVDLEHGNIRCGRLRKVMQNILSESDLKYLAFAEQDKILIDYGKIDTLPPLTAVCGEVLLKNYLFYWKPPPAKSHCKKRNHRHGSDLKNLDANVGLHKNHRFLIALDASAYHEQISEARQKTNIISVSLLLIVGLFLCLWLHSLKSQRLKNQLSLANERMSRFKEFELAAFGLAHETRHPLGIIRATAQKLMKIDPGHKEKVLVEKIIEEADVTSSRLGEFMDYARLKEPNLSSFSANDFFTQLTELLRPDFEAKNLLLSVEVDKLTIEADRDMLQRTTINLLLNSLKACNEGDEISLSMTSDNHKGCLKIADTGSGIPEKIKDKVFEPYVSGNENGHGIGLAIVKKIAAEHRWEISVDSKLNCGTTFEIFGIKVVEDSKSA